MDVVRVPGWEQWEWLRHGFSTRGGGVSEVYGAGEFNLGFTKEDDPERVAENRARFAGEVSGGGVARLVAVRQVHGVGIKTVLAEDDGGGGEADGLLTDASGVMLGIQVADCVPVLVADTRQRVVGAFHAGWRGTLGGIVELGVARMVEEFGARVEDMVGAVGPSIGGCCYSVGDEVKVRFEERFADARELFTPEEDGLHLDLAEANRRQMVRAGLAAGKVRVLGECTACARVGGRRKYFSHRAERGFTGRGMGMIGILRGKW